MKYVKCGNGKTYSIPMTDIEYIGYFYGKNGKETVQSAYTRLKKLRGRAPDFLFNAELFNFKDRKAASDVVCGGKIHRLTENFGMAFPNNNKAVFSYKNNVNAADYVGAYPVLVRNGVKEVSVPAGTEGSRGRTAIGVGNGQLHIALIPDGGYDVTMSMLRNSFLNVGATDAINLDGGGSTQYYAPNGNFFSGRAVRGFIGIWLKKPVAPVRTVKVNSYLRVRQSPSLVAKVVGKLYNGNKVTVLETKGGWSRISTGWVYSSYLI